INQTKAMLLFLSLFLTFTYCSFQLIITALYAFASTKKLPGNFNEKNLFVALGFSCRVCKAMARKIADGINNYNFLIGNKSFETNFTPKLTSITFFPFDSKTMVAQQLA